MNFVGDLDFKAGRSPKETVTLVLQRCLAARGKDVGTFLKGQSIDPMAFFTEINGDWRRKRAIGRHVFEVLKDAGYKGTENDVWYSVTGTTAPPVVTKPTARSKKGWARKKTGA